MGKEESMHRRWIVALSIAGVLALVAGRALAADKKPDATVALSEGSVAAGIGWHWGSGSLTFQGQSHPFKIQGVSVGEVGVTRAEASGNVYNLEKLSDFDGVYVAASAGAAAGEGAGVTSVRNARGVVINLKSDTQGVNLKIAAEGVKIDLER
jgi:hypothetical protein